MKMEEGSIFKALYHGEVAPWSKSQLPKLEEYNAIAKKMVELQDEINAFMTDSEKEVFENFMQAYISVSAFFEEEKFKDGFILGTKLMIEVFQDKSFQ
ncbi:MAG: hypothetical protein R3Y24_11955 [Eubacteriales bacterium]